MNNVCVLPLKRITLVPCSTEAAVHSWNTVITQRRTSLWGSESTLHSVTSFNPNPLWIHFTRSAAALSGATSCFINSTKRIGSWKSVKNPRVHRLLLHTCCCGCYRCPDRNTRRWSKPVIATNKQRLHSLSLTSSLRGSREQQSSSDDLRLRVGI